MEALAERFVDAVEGIATALAKLASDRPSEAVETCPTCGSADLDALVEGDEEVALQCMGCGRSWLLDGDEEKPQGVDDALHH